MTVKRDKITSTAVIREQFEKNITLALFTTNVQNTFHRQLPTYAVLLYERDVKL